MKKTFHHILGALTYPQAFGAIGYLFLISWTGDLLLNCFSGDCPDLWLWLIPAILIIVTIWLVRISNDYFKRPVETKLFKEYAPSCKGLILFLSENKKLSEIDQNSPVDADNLASFGNWQMPLTAILHHAERLTDLVVICSKNSKPQFDLFKQFSLRLLPNITIHDPLEANFFETGNIHNQTQQAYELLEKLGMHKKDIIVDATGGTSLVAIGATLASVEEDRFVQYVRTDNYQVLAVKIGTND